MSMQETTSDSIHGHEVLQMMLASGQPYTRESLKTDILARFGAAARFHTCSAENMSADELIEFLDARGKFIGGEGGFNTEPTRICKS
jgi:probable metal-binding protein